MISHSQGYKLLRKVGLTGLTDECQKIRASIHKHLSKAY